LPLFPPDHTPIYCWKSKAI